MRNYRALIDNDDYIKMVEQARRRAEHELGDAIHADTIIEAFLHPGRDEANLRREMREDW